MGLLSIAVLAGVCLKTKEEIARCRGCKYHDTTWGERTGQCMHSRKKLRKCPLGKWELTRSGKEKKGGK